MHHEIPSWLKSQIGKTNSKELDSFNYNDYLFKLNDDAILSFGNIKKIYRAKICKIFLVSDLQRAQKFCKKQTNSKKIKKTKPKNFYDSEEAEIALLVKVRFYFSLDDLNEIDMNFTNVKEMFLSTKSHYVYAYNFIAKCLIQQKFPEDSSDEDKFFCWRCYDPKTNSIQIKEQN